MLLVTLSFRRDVTVTDCISSLVTALLSASLVTRNSCCCQRVEKIQDRAEKIHSMENKRWKVALGFLPIPLIFYFKTAFPMGCLAWVTCGFHTEFKLLMQPNCYLKTI